MSGYQLTRETLEARDIVSDCASIARRMEDYRHRISVTEPNLIVREEEARLTLAGQDIPEVVASDLTAATLRNALAEHGALIVRNLFSDAETSTLIQAIEQVLAASASSRAVRTKLAST